MLLVMAVAVGLEDRGPTCMGGCPLLLHGGDAPAAEPALRYPEPALVLVVLVRMALLPGRVPGRWRHALVVVVMVVLGRLHRGCAPAVKPARRYPELLLPMGMLAPRAGVLMLVVVVVVMLVAPLELLVLLAPLAAAAGRGGRCRRLCVLASARRCRYRVSRRRCALASCHGALMVRSAGQPPLSRPRGGSATTPLRAPPREGSAMPPKE